MNTEILGLILDGLVLVLLAATIFIAWRLSENLTVFRKSRKDMDRLVQDLSRNVEKAELAITGLKAATRDAGKDLDVLVNEARALSDELQLMTEAGDNIASRLERLAERNRDIAERIEKSGGGSTARPAPPSIPPKRAQEEKRVPAGPSFAIRDREFNGDDGEAALAIAAEEENERPGPGSLHSKAERELFEALRKGGKAKPGDFR